MKKHYVNVIAIILAISLMCSITSFAANDDNLDVRPLRGEYLKTFRLNLDELYALREYTHAYYESLDNKNPSILAEYIGDFAVDSVVKVVFGYEVSTAVAGIRALIRIAKNEEVRAIQETTMEGLIAIDRAIDGYRNTEEWLSRPVIEAEVQFSVYTRWDYPDVEFIEGGGYIQRIHVRDGWISPGREYMMFLKKKYKEI
ncbi:MAG: hypothetical protein MSH08_03090 [Ezakiella sp.]|nr:hypothetical protein [Ezakiella sp.]MDD7471468.1 hypothetical protein [Bacillota bacterium]MDY3923670.1 hypothetical protein [Ezakiella sp.]